MHDEVIVFSGGMPRRLKGAREMPNARSWCYFGNLVCRDHAVDVIYGESGIVHGSLCREYGVGAKAVFEVLVPATFGW